MPGKSAKQAKHQEQDAGSAKPGGRAYGAEKTHGSAKYHGMKVGGVHRWTYPDGQWTERKVRPDRWDVTYTSLKRRNTRAPRGSGAETGSGYHWFIAAHQWVEKLDANTYATHLEGSKYLVAFKKPDWPVWNTQFRNAKRHAKEKTVAALQDAIRMVESGELDLEDPQEGDALAELAARFAEKAYQEETEAKTVAIRVEKEGEEAGKAQKEEREEGEGKEQEADGTEEDEGGEAGGVTARRSRKRRRSATRPRRRRKQAVER